MSTLKTKNQGIEKLEEEVKEIEKEEKTMKDMEYQIFGNLQKVERKVKFITNDL